MDSGDFMSNELVLRSFYVPASDDTDLRQLAFELNIPKSDLVRAAIASKLETWRKLNDREAIFKDIKLGDRASAEQDSDSMEVVAERPVAERQKNPRRRASSAASKKSDVRARRIPEIGGATMSGIA
jgi:hypothetical protein